MSRCTYLSAFCRFTTVLATAPAWAQHTELAANRDGSVLYVISHSVLRDATTPTHAQTRLYRVSPDGAKLFAEKEETIPASAGTTTSYSSSDGIAVPQVSDDGQTVAYTVRGVCVSDPCVRGAVAKVKGA